MPDSRPSRASDSGGGISGSASTSETGTLVADRHDHAPVEQWQQTSPEGYCRSGCGPVWRWWSPPTPPPGGRRRATTRGSAPSRLPRPPPAAPATRSRPGLGSRSRRCRSWSPPAGGRAGRARWRWLKEAVDGVVQIQDPVQVTDLEHPANAWRGAHQGKIAAPLAQSLERADDRSDAERVDEVQLRQVDSQQAGAPGHCCDHGLAQVGGPDDIEVAADAEDGPRRLLPAPDRDGPQAKTVRLPESTRRYSSRRLPESTRALLQSPPAGIDSALLQSPPAGIDSALLQSPPAGIDSALLQSPPAGIDSALLQSHSGPGLEHHVPDPAAPPAERRWARCRAVAPSPSRRLAAPPRPGAAGPSRPRR